MVKCRIIANIADDFGSWEEPFVVTLEKCTNHDAENYLKSVLSCFNSSLRQNESKRKLFNVISVCCI